MSAEWHNGTSTQLFMTLGTVFNKTFTINLGVLLPSQTGSGTIYTLGVSITFAKPATR